LPIAINPFGINGQGRENMSRKKGLECHLVG